ncbi:hypothetical protein [Methyloversatilis thermotolerans]|uniref:hypothetical protein n=1 Tax=Methyloversatilis thermotolerans TaxID=1346290 RepID=UPI000372A300|nr:hypothetical protein [Methyloversatilis thermotolerans]
MNARLTTLTLASILALGLMACEKEGPAERAGKAVDEAVEEAGDKLDDAREKARDAIDDARK